MYVLLFVSQAGIFRIAADLTRNPSNFFLSWTQFKFSCKAFYNQIVK